MLCITPSNILVLTIGHDSIVCVYVCVFVLAYIGVHVGDTELACVHTEGGKWIQVWILY